MRELRLVINFGDHCNLQCSYCHQKVEQDSKSTMCLETLDMIIEKTEQYYKDGNGRLLIAFLGGEPTLYADKIYRVMNSLKEYNIQYAISTNGTKQDVIEEMSKISDRITVVYGNKEQSDLPELVKGTYSVYNHVLTPYNLKDIDLDFIESLDFKRSSFKFDYLSDWSSVNKKELLETCELIINRHKSNNIIKLETPLIKRTTKNDKLSMGHECGDFNTINVDVDGNVILCQRDFNIKSNRKKSIGNISESSILELHKTQNNIATNKSSYCYWIKKEKLETNANAIVDILKDLDLEKVDQTIGCSSEY